MVNVNKLKGKIVENGLSISDLAEKMGVDKTTLYRKISGNGESFSIKDVNLIAQVLKLNIYEINNIFFSQYVA
ncbi:MAG: helix-turn-helix domain-containing protein [Lachnotalea sp.]